MPDKQTQLDKFKQAARQIEADDDPKRFEERLKKLVKKRLPARPRVGGSEKG